jgi:hypothetical protein
MHDEPEYVQIHVFNTFQLVPHMGLARMEAAIESLGLGRTMRYWKSVGSADFPRVEYIDQHSVYGLSMGVTRQPFSGYSSWMAIQAVDENQDRSSAIRLMYRETDRFWLRSWTKGTRPDPKIDQLVAEWFPKGEPELRLDNEDFVNLTLQHFVILLNGD